MTTLYIPTFLKNHIDPVKLSPGVRPRVVIDDIPTGGYRMEFYWDQGVLVDRPDTVSTVMSDYTFALRLKRAIDSGHFFTNPHVVKDVNNHTYVIYGESPLLATHDDLTKLGF